MVAADGASVEVKPAARPAGSSASRTAAGETRGVRLGRKIRRVLLYLCALVALALVLALAALVLANPSPFRISWLLGASSVSLAWLLLPPTILAFLLGLVLGVLPHRRKRRG
jgi:hypothetical protein